MRSQTQVSRIESCCSCRLGERYVEIIADHQTHALAPDGAWNKIVDRFLTTVKAGRVADGVLDAIAACGAILREHHPA